MKTALIVRPPAREELGPLQPLLEQAGYVIHYLEADVAALAQQAPLAADLVVVLGTPVAAATRGNDPWPPEHISWLRQRLLADRPTLGIRYGAQWMARALNARVYAGSRQQSGWAPLTLGREGEDFAGMAEYLAQAPAVPHWPGDAYDLPSGARHLAASALCETQAFAWGAHCLALHFSPHVASHIAAYATAHTQQPTAAAQFLTTWLATLSGCRCRPVLAPLVRMERPPCRRHF